MASDAFEMGYAAGNAIARGLSEWKSIQRDKQEKSEFDGAMALASQRRSAARQAIDPQDEQLLREYEARAKRSPGARISVRQTGNVQEDGTAEEEQVIETPEGDIPVGQVLMLRQRNQQNKTALQIADVDLIMELQARYPNNRYVKQWAASTYAGIQQQQDIFAKQVQQQRLQLDIVAQQRQIALERDRFGLEREKFEKGPEREREQEKFETDQGIRQDAARIEAQRKADIDVEGVRAQNKPERPATEFVKKLQQMAPRAQEALEQLDALDIDRTSLASGAESLLPNVAKSGERQRFDQAKLQFVNSILRAESGATITEGELDKAIKQYFPVVGDSPETVQQKRKARETAVQGLFSAAELEPPQPRATGGDDLPDDIKGILEKY
jgi:hypothetical protein